MKKKKLKKLLRAALRKIEARTPIKHRSKAKSVPPEVFSLMEKVKKQLEEIKKPPPSFHRTETSWEPTVADYIAMDPCHWSTMRIVRNCGRIIFL